MTNFESTQPLRTDLALALRAAAHHGLSEGICNHFSVMLPGQGGEGGSDKFLLNPRGLHWSEVQADDIVMCNAAGEQLAGRHSVEPTAMFIHAAVHRITGHAVVLHTHMPHATALTLTAQRALDTTLSQGAMRFHGRVAVDENYNGLALDMLEGERIARAMLVPGVPTAQGKTLAKGAAKDVAFLGNHGIVVCGARIDYAYDDLYYLERECQLQVLALSTGLKLLPLPAALADKVAAQIDGERLQSALFFESLRRLVR